MTRETELSALAGRFPGWEAWRGVSGLFYARLRGTEDEPVSGEDPTDLADSIERAERLAAAGELPARHLDRIRREHPAWRVQHVTAGFGWTAHRGGERIWAGTLPELERQLAAAAKELPPDGLSEKGEQKWDS
jgi:hypothetical protein